MAYRAPEGPALQRWRLESVNACATIDDTASQLEKVLLTGGAELISSQRATIKRLTAELSKAREQEGVKRYKSLQQDLKERDVMVSELRKLLKANTGQRWTDDALNSHIDDKLLLFNKVKQPSQEDPDRCEVVYQDMRLYGASRELLLRENKALRAQLEQRLITSRTGGPAPSSNPVTDTPAHTTSDVHSAQPSSPHASTRDQNTTSPTPPHTDTTTHTNSPTHTRSPGPAVILSPTASPLGKVTAATASPLGRGTALTKSQLATAVVKASEELRALQTLVGAGKQLRAACDGYKLPLVTHTGTQADDGAQGLITRLREQVEILSGQKAQLIHKVSDLESALQLSEARERHTKDLVAEERRKHTELLAHQGNLSGDLRAHLKAESARGDAAETAAAEAAARARACERQSESLAAQLVDRRTELAALRAALEEKDNQIRTLKSLHDELRSELHDMRSHVSHTHSETGDRLMQAMDRVFQDIFRHTQDSAATLSRVAAAAAATHAAVDAMGATQRTLVEQVTTTQQAAVDGLSRALESTRTALTDAEKDRRLTHRQLIAGQLLGRLEDRRFLEAVAKLRSDLPESLATQLAAHTAAVNAAVGPVQDARQFDSPVQTDIIAQADHTSDTADANDPTTRLIQESRLLRAQLSALLAVDAITPASPGAAPARTVQAAGAAAGGAAATQAAASQPGQPAAGGPVGTVNQQGSARSVGPSCSSPAQPQPPHSPPASQPPATTAGTQPSTGEGGMWLSLNRGTPPPKPVHTSLAGLVTDPVFAPPPQQPSAASTAATAGPGAGAGAGAGVAASVACATGQTAAAAVSRVPAYKAAPVPQGAAPTGAPHSSTPTSHAVRTQQTPSAATTSAHQPASGVQGTHTSASQQTATPAVHATSPTKHAPGAQAAQTGTLSEATERDSTAEHEEAVTSSPQPPGPYDKGLRAAFASFLAHRSPPAAAAAAGAGDVDSQATGAAGAARGVFHERVAFPAHATALVADPRESPLRPRVDMSDEL